ncbi:uncharacterized protein LOC135496674 [Lineus longissimus]|uniref:uncharacterized protein LOC135496674 n=1 Tax=Lineus longissimus TaxID=88925 RepID=UPI002B4CE46C
MTQRLVFSILVLSSISFAFATTEPNKPADTTEDLLSQFEFDRRLDEEYAGQTYPQRGDVVVAPDLYELGPQKFDFETTIADLENSNSEQHPTFSERVPLDTEPAEVRTFADRVSTGTEPIAKVSQSTVASKVKASDSLPKNHETGTNDEPARAVHTESKLKPSPDEDTYHLYKKIKTILRQPDIDSRLHNDTSTSGDNFVPTIASFPGRNPSEDDAGNDIIMTAVLPAAIVLVACLVIASLALILYCTFRKPAKTIGGERSGAGRVQLTGVHNRWEAFEDARSKGQPPNQRFCSKGNFYAPNIVDQMPENLLNDKTVYVDSKSDKLVVRSDASCHSLSPMILQNVEHDDFYSKLLDNEAALKTPAGLGEDADSKSLYSDSKLRFVTVPLEDDDTAPTPTGGKRVGHVTHVCHI